MRSLQIRNGLYQNLGVLSKMKGQSLTKTINEILIDGILAESYQILKHIDPEVNLIDYNESEADRHRRSRKAGCVMKE